MTPERLSTGSRAGPPAGRPTGTLSAGQIERFLVDGFLRLEPASLTADDHRFLHGRAVDIHEHARAVDSPTAHLDILGDTLRTTIPELDRLLSDPVVDGALNALLGPGYVLHPHSYCHRSSRRDQIFHQDGNLPWNQRGHDRSHRLDWAMLFYYPQDVHDANGPTEVVAGSHYWTIDHEREDGGWHPGDRVDRSIDPAIFEHDDHELRDRVQAEALSRGLPVPGLDRRFLQVPAGTVLLAHYDLFHRGSRALGHSEPRFLYKFYFARVCEPTGDTPALRSPAPGSTRATLHPVVDANRRWLSALGPGDAADTRGPPPTEREVSSLVRLLHGGREDERVAAAYRLGRAVEAGGAGATTALASLEAALGAESEGVRRAAGHGLRQAGASGIAPLVRGLASPAAPTRRRAAAGLGTPEAVRSPAAVAALIRLLATDPDDLVRSNAAYSLGQIARAAGSGAAPDLDVAPIVDALLDRLEQGVEPDNAFDAELARSTIRQSAAFGLLQALANHVLTDEQLDRITTGPLHDPDRYVRGLVAEGVARHPNR